MLQTRRPALSGNALKGIAILAMTLDHLTWTLWPGYATDWWVLVCHVLGRVTAPIMWFFIVEGYHYTHDVKSTPRACSRSRSSRTLRMISASASRFCRCPPGRSIRRASCGRSRGGWCCSSSTTTRG